MGEEDGYRLVEIDFISKKNFKKGEEKRKRLGKETEESAR
jgi:hypothetical protein